MPRTTDTVIEFERPLYQQVPQHETTADLELCFKFCKFNNAHVMKRAKKLATIKEVNKCVLEELWGLLPDEIPYEIFSKENRLGIDGVFVLSKEKMHHL